jgi:hypothetical protein
MLTMLRRFCAQSRAEDANSGQTRNKSRLERQKQEKRADSAQLIRS